MITQKSIGGRMKMLISCIVLISLCSCGRSSSLENQNQTDEVRSQKAESFTMAQLNFHKSVTIDWDINSFYENMSINPLKKGSVLGDEAFYIMIYRSTFHDEVHLNFYNKTKVNSIFYFDFKNSPSTLLEINKDNLSALKLKEITDFFKDGLTWGKHNLDNPENDMLNKAYIVRTEEMQSKENLEFKSQSNYLIWFECLGNVQEINEYTYSCSKHNLKFHYKLLDYSLISN